MPCCWHLRREVSRLLPPQFHSHSYKALVCLPTAWELPLGQQSYALEQVRAQILSWRWTRNRATQSEYDRGQGSGWRRARAPDSVNGVRSLQRNSNLKFTPPRYGKNAEWAQQRTARATRRLLRGKDGGERRGGEEDFSRCLWIFWSSLKRREGKRSSDRASERASERGKDWLELTWQLRFFTEEAGPPFYVIPA